MSDYVPTIPEVNGIRNGWACAHVREDITPEAAYAAFDGWLAETIREAKAEAWDEGLWAGATYHPSRRDFEDMYLDVEPAPPVNPYAEEADHE